MRHRIAALGAAISFGASMTAGSAVVMAEDKGGKDRVHAPNLHPAAKQLEHAENQLERGPSTSTAVIAPRRFSS